MPLYYYISLALYTLSVAKAGASKQVYLMQNAMMGRDLKKKVIGFINGDCFKYTARLLEIFQRFDVEFQLSWIVVSDLDLLSAQIIEEIVRRGPGH